MKFVAGIDGGGTKTRVMCRSLDGQELAARVFGAFNLNSIGLEKFRSLLGEITAFLNDLGECEALCIGSAGISNELMVKTVSEAMEDAGIRRWKLVGDHVIALYGALEGAPGIALIAGTGTICVGRGRYGEEVRAGGWGHLIGDEGSGYALGRDAIAAFAGEWDGCGEKTCLTQLLSERGLDTQRKIISYVYGGDKSRVAALADLVEQAARAGDAVANRIIKDNAKALCELVVAVEGKLKLKKTRVAMLGGLLEHDTALKEAFLSAMAERNPEICCVEPLRDACAGAVMMAEAMLETEEISG